MFRVSIAAIIRSAKSLNAASDTGHCNGANTFIQRGPIRTRWRKVVACYYDLNQGLHLPCFVFLMKIAIKARNI